MSSAAGEFHCVTDPKRGPWNGLKVVKGKKRRRAKERGTVRLFEEQKSTQFTNLAQGLPEMKTHDSYFVTRTDITFKKDFLHLVKNFMQTKRENAQGNLCVVRSPPPRAWRDDISPRARVSDPDSQALLRDLGIIESVKGSAGAGAGRRRLLARKHPSVCEEQVSPLSE